jgi:DNA adenine methylase
MPSTPSPLRYPGGKTSIREMVRKIIEINGLERGHYAEPYAGGCGLALTMLFNDVVHELHLNDIDRSIYSFWDAVLNNTEQLIDKMMTTKVDIDQWRLQREIQLNKDVASEFDLAFSTLFLNRTNRSGIILKAGVIGGLKQEGAYKLDCRFNKDGLGEKIRRIAKYKHRIHFYNLDAIDFIERSSTEIKSPVFYCIDPPYYAKGSALYTNFYEPEDHKNVADSIMELDHPWMLTYDNRPEIRDLYKRRNQKRFYLNYSAARKRTATELLIVSKGLRLDGDLHLMEVIQ